VGVGENVRIRSTPPAREAGPLLERQAELGAIVRALHGARAAEGSIVMIDAAPGLGKTRLVAEAVEASGGFEMQVLRATGRELERDFPRPRSAAVRGATGPGAGGHAEAAAGGAGRAGAPAVRGRAR
jgi:hypothetical protein